MKNIITTACPSIVYLIETYYPELIDQLAPVVSPMIAHAKMLRETYGQRIRVVFIGPCLSKKSECNDIQDLKAVDAVLTFEDLSIWLQSEGILIDDEFNEEMKTANDMSARIYPVPGGILKTIQNKYKKKYHCIGIDGVEQCIEILDSIQNGEVSNYFIEMNSCQGGCIHGPCMTELKGGYLKARTRLLEYMKNGYQNKSLLPNMESKINLHKKFINRTRTYKIPSEAVIQGILNSTGKFTKDKELNCGACGYESCREKAIAVFQNKAQLFMCLPYMRERAESISNLIINTTPNAILALDNELMIQEINASAREKFHVTSEDMIGRNIFTLLECEDFANVLVSGNSIYDKKYYYSKLDMTVMQSIILIPEQNIIVAIIKDITEEENQRKKMYEIRSENVELTQKIIEKQMRIAQEIASLLGETTAETKVALTKLKNSIIAEMTDKE